MDEPIIDYLRRRLREAGPRRWERIAAAAGVPRRFPARLAYGERANPTMRSVQPLLDYFAAVDRGSVELPAPDIDRRYLSEAHGAPAQARGAISRTDEKPPVRRLSPGIT
jgi:hypothetical protein